MSGRMAPSPNSHAIPFYMKCLLWAWLPVLGFFVILAYFNHTNGVPHSTGGSAIEGEWGPVTANVDWCEENYIFTSYIAEVLNSLSSLAFCVVGLFGVWTSVTKKLESRFTVCYFCIFLVGLGSAVFHATLLRATQAMDEVPMAFSMLSIAYILESVEHDPKAPRNRVLPAVLFGVGLFMLCLYVAFPGNAVPFQSLFVSSIAFVMITLVRRTKVFITHDTGKKLLAFAMGFFLLGCSSWLMERETCAHLIALNLHWLTFFALNMHAWWHIFISFGLYFFIIYNEFIRLHFLGRNPQMKVFVLPFVVPESAVAPVAPSTSDRLEEPKPAKVDDASFVALEERRSATFRRDTLLSDLPKRRPSPFEPAGARAGLDTIVGREKSS